MKKVLTPRRHAVPLKTGERLPTPEENSAAIARGRHEMTMKLVLRFPQVKVIGIEGPGEILIELPDDIDLLRRVRSELDVETGPAPDEERQMPVWRDIRPTAEDVAEARAGSEYRPTVVALIRDERDRILLLQSRFNHDEWMFVQGGIEEGEEPLSALAREIREEIDVGPSFFAPSAYVGTADLDAEDGRTDKRGYTKGKRYFIYEVAYRGPEEMRIQTSELNEYAWVGPRLDDLGLLHRLSGVRKGKAGLMLGAIIRTLR